MIDELNYSMISSLGKQIRRKLLSPFELTRHCVERCELLNPMLNCFVAIYAEEALDAARLLEKEVVEGNYRGPLHGIPIGVKDNCDVAGKATTGCSKALLKNIAVKDASFIRRLKKAGAIILGKTNMHELAYGGTGEVSYFGPARNPWNLECNAGGSSSGSGVAVSAGIVAAAFGSDTGGSIRIPSSACGITGHKPTYGSVSKAGVLPLSWTLDHVGPLVRSVEDSLIVLSSISGQDSEDRSMIYPVSTEPPFSHSNLILGAARFPEYSLDPEVEQAFNAALRQMETIGFSIELIDLQHAGEAHVSWLAIMYSEASSRYKNILYERYFDFSEDVRSQLEAGLHLLAETYLKAQRFRSFYIHYFESLMDKYDSLIMPSLPTVAPRIGQKEVNLPNKTVSTQDAMTFMNLTANMIGWPAISIPCGFSGCNLPIGLTVLSTPARKGYGIHIAKTYQESTQWHLYRPPLFD